MKTFVSLSIDYDHPQESGVVVFQAENEEAAVLEVVKDILIDEIEDFEENAEPGDEITDFVNTFMLDDYPVMIKEVDPTHTWETAKSEEFNIWYEDDITGLLMKKYPKK